MLKFGRLAIYLGSLLTAIGLIFGMTALFLDADTLGMTLISLVPPGTLLVFAGLVVRLLHAPASAAHPDPDGD